MLALAANPFRVPIAMSRSVAAGFPRSRPAQAVAAARRHRALGAARIALVVILAWFMLAGVAHAATGWTGTVTVNASHSFSGPAGSDSATQEVVYLINGSLATGHDPNPAMADDKAIWWQPARWAASYDEGAASPNGCGGTFSMQSHAQDGGTATGQLEIGPPDQAVQDSYLNFEWDIDSVRPGNQTTTLSGSCDPTGDGTVSGKWSFCPGSAFAPNAVPDGTNATRLHGSLTFTEQHGCRSDFTATVVSWSLARGIHDEDLDGWDDDTADNCTPAQLPGVRPGIGDLNNTVAKSWNPDQSVNPCARTPACADSADNDGDGLTDYPDDPGCLSAVDDDEHDQYSLGVGIQGDGKGLVSSGDGISCPTNCIARYDPGTVVTLTATPDAGWAFDHWEGACTGSGVCNVTMNADMNVTAVLRVADRDGDGVPNTTDNCIDTPNANGQQQDADLDGVGDACDENAGPFVPAKLCARPVMHVSFFASVSFRASEGDGRPRTNGCWSFDRPFGRGFTPSWTEPWVGCRPNLPTPSPDERPGWITYDDVDTNNFGFVNGAASVTGTLSNCLAALGPPRNTYIQTFWRLAFDGRPARFLTGPQRSALRQRAGAGTVRFIDELYYPGSACPAKQIPCTEPIVSPDLYEVWKDTDRRSGVVGELDATNGASNDDALTYWVARLCKDSASVGQMALFLQSTGGAPSFTRVQKIASAISACTAELAGKR
jgi:Divergent InlB B-repeat domain